MRDAATAAQAQRRRRAHPVYLGWAWNGTIPLDDAARKGLVLRRIERWREAVDLQHERLTSPGERHGGPDLHFYVIAVDNLIDAVKVIHKQYPNLPGVRSAVDRAVNRFEKACPDIPDLRDLVEHFDAYDHMVGNLQKSGQVPHQRMGQVENYSLLDGDAQLSIFGRHILVSATTVAARQLAAEVLALSGLLPG